MFICVCDRVCMWGDKYINRQCVSVCMCVYKSILSILRERMGNPKFPSEAKSVCKNKQHTNKFTEN